jgi:DNA repair exonuclease SbcCD ATPase subunit
MAYAEKEVRTHRKLVENTKQNAITLTDKLEVLSWVIEAEAKFEKLDAESRDLRQRKSQLSKLDTLLYRIDQTGEKLKQYQHVPEMRSKLDELLQISANIKGDASHLARLNGLINDIEMAEKKLQSYVKVPEMRERLDRHLQMATEINEREKKLERLEYLINNIFHAKNKVDRLSTQLKAAEEEFHAAFPDRCPLCGQEVKK